MGHGSSRRNSGRSALEALLAAPATDADPPDLRIPADDDALLTAALAAGYTPGPRWHVYGIDGAVVRAWPRAIPRVRRARPDDLGFIRLLHGAEFSASYTTAGRLVGAPDRITLVIESADGAALGYASGHTEPDGSGRLDFMAVHPDARGVGDGRLLLMATAQAVMRTARVPRLRLEIEEARRPAIRFYEQAGFEHEGTLVELTRPGGVPGGALSEPTRR